MNAKISIPDFSIRRRALLPLTAGLAVSQMIATLFVGQSNQALGQSVQALEAAGWLAIPAGPAAAELHSLGAAFWGGLFYTLSIGIGLSLVTWAFLSLWHRLLQHQTTWLWVPAGCWVMLLVAVNLKGWVFYPTLFVLCTPLATALAAIVRPKPVPSSKAHKLWPIPLLTLTLLTGVWATQFNARLFIAIRDHLLLSNPVGQGVNDFYYRYTLYAAQTFKSFEQLTVRTCRLDHISDPQTEKRLTTLLARHDILKTPDNPQADAVIAISPNRLQWRSRQGNALEMAQDAFLADPMRWLRRFSEDSDRYGPFRRMTFVGLLIGFPILLYVLVDGLIARGAGLFVNEPTLIWIRAGLCLFIGMLLFVPMLAAGPADIQKSDIASALAAKDWPQRVAALGLMEKEKIEIAEYPQYRTLLESPWVVERYYLARALAVSRDSTTYDDLLGMLVDAHPNVVCQVYFALGRRGNRAAISAIKTQMMQSNHWYTQWYGYRALRSLGWRQTASK